MKQWALLHSESSERLRLVPKKLKKCTYLSKIRYLYSPFMAWFEHMTLTKVEEQELSAENLTSGKRKFNFGQGVKPFFSERVG